MLDWMQDHTLLEARDALAEPKRPPLRQVPPHPVSSHLPSIVSSKESESLIDIYIGASCEQDCWNTPYYGSRWDGHHQAYHARHLWSLPGTDNNSYTSSDRYVKWRTQLLRVLSILWSSLSSTTDPITAFVMAPWKYPFFLKLFLCFFC